MAVYSNNCYKCNSNNNNINESSIYLYLSKILKMERKKREIGANKTVKITGEGQLV